MIAVRCTLFIPGNSGVLNFAILCARAASLCSWWELERRICRAEGGSIGG